MRIRPVDGRRGWLVEPPPPIAAPCAAPASLPVPVSTASADTAPRAVEGAIERVISDVPPAGPARWRPFRRGQGIAGTLRGRRRCCPDRRAAAGPVRHADGAAGHHRSGRCSGGRWRTSSRCIGARRRLTRSHMLTACPPPREPGPARRRGPRRATCRRPATDRWGDGRRASRPSESRSRSASPAAHVSRWWPVAARRPSAHTRTGTCSRSAKTARTCSITATRARGARPASRRRVAVWVRDHLHTHPAAIALAFGLARPPSVDPRFNIAPMTDIRWCAPTSMRTRKLTMTRRAWCRVGEGPAIGAKMINARGETIAESVSGSATGGPRRRPPTASTKMDARLARGPTPQVAGHVGMKDGRTRGGGVSKRWLSPDGDVPTPARIVTTDDAPPCCVQRPDAVIVAGSATHAGWLDLDGERCRPGAPFPLGVVRPGTRCRRRLEQCSS